MSYNKDDLKLWVANGNFKTQNIFDQAAMEAIYQARLALYSAPQKPGLEYINRLVAFIRCCDFFDVLYFQ
jgi:hypothetical protein